MGHCVVAAVNADNGLDEVVGGRCLREILAEGSPGLFDDGCEQMRLQLLQFQDGTVSVQARVICEIGLGILHDSGLTADFPEHVMHAAGYERACAGIELIAARVAQVHGLNEGQQTRRRLAAIATNCDFAEDAQMPVRRPRKSDADLLASELPLGT